MDRSNPLTQTERLRIWARIAAFVLLVSLELLIPARVAAQRDTSARENLGSAVNSSSIEILPLITPDGSTLYFDRKHSSGNVGGTRDEDDIYECLRLGLNGWSPARNLGSPLNSDGSDVLFWLSVDGSSALVYTERMKSPGYTGLAITHRSGDGWGEPVPIIIEGISDLGDSYYAYITPDRRRMILAYARNRVHPDDLDLHVCSAIGTDLLSWSKPVSIGMQINTAGFDGAPFVALDNRSLYFASTHHTGFGQSDLFLSRRLDDTWVRWTVPVNLGPVINTMAFEASLSIPLEGTHAYISAGASYGDLTFGKSDIYRVLLPDSLRPDPALVVSGTLAAGGSGIDGLIRAERLVDGREVAAIGSSPHGAFVLVLDTGIAYRLVGWAPGYDESEIMIDPGGNRMITDTIRLAGTGPRPLYEGMLQPALRIAPLHFMVGSDRLSSAAGRTLRRHARVLSSAIASGTVRSIVVAGHTDSVGAEEANILLSRRRATRVRQALIDLGVDSSIISIAAFGEHAPTDSNRSTHGRMRNRRVELELSGAFREDQP